MLNSATAQVHLHFVTYIPYIICIYIETLLPVIHTSKSGLTHCPPYALVGGSKSYQNDVIVQFYLYYILFSFTYRFPLSPFSPFLDFFFVFSKIFLFLLAFFIYFCCCCYYHFATDSFTSAIILHVHTYNTTYTYVHTLQLLLLFKWVA